jgi:hypothetical protein
MENYYKLINGELTLPTSDQYLSIGYKILITTPRPNTTIPNKYTKLFPVYVENENTITQNWELRPISNINEIKKMKLEDLRKYDISSDVNEFIINGLPMWINKNDRASLMYSIQSEEQLGILTTSIYTTNIPSIKLEIPIQTAKSFLQALEVYAKECYCITKEHQNAINSLTDAQQIIDYDFTFIILTKLSCFAITHGIDSLSYFIDK